MTDAPIVTFGIPLMGRAVARDWERVVHHFNATLGSLYNQTDPNFRIIVACTDRPELRLPVDERLEFIEVPQHAGSGYGPINSDAGIKRHAIGGRVREHGGGYLMYVDADDLVSARLVDHVRQSVHPGGFVIRRGYFLDAETGRLSPFPLRAMQERSFDQICGTCCVVRFDPDELPGGSSATMFDKLISCGHNHTAAAAERMGRPLADVPFRAAVYVKNTGENVSNVRSDDNPYLSFATGIAGRAASEAIPITCDMNQEFGLMAACHESSGLRPLARRETLSIAVCTYRRPAGLNRLLHALAPQILGQSARELIVYNDGSHDDAYQAVIDGFGGGLSYLKGERNRGTAFARNRAAAAASGEYVVFIDDDCVPPPAWLDWVEARLISCPETDVVAGTTVPLWNGRPRLFDRVQDHHRLLPHPIRLGDETIYVTASFCVRRRLLEDLGGFVENPHFTSAGEDTELSVRLQRHGARIRVDPHWSVAHELGTLRQYLRRYRGYGYINTMATEMMTAPAVLMPHRHVRRRSLFRRAIRAWQKETQLAQSFPGKRWERVAAAGAAALVRIAYDTGCAEAAAELRSRSAAAGP